MDIFWPKMGFTKCLEFKSRAMACQARSGERFEVSGGVGDALLGKERLEKGGKFKSTQNATCEI